MDSDAGSWNVKIKNSERRRKKKMEKYVLTGGPGVGKSTLLKELAKYPEICTIDEVAAYIIQAEEKKGSRCLPWIDRDAFQLKVLETQLEWEREIPESIEKAILDRGIPDGLAYYRHDKITPPGKLVKAAREADYTGIFLLSDLIIYQNTSVRREDEEEARKIHSMIRQTYKELGYKLIPIPLGSVEERTKMILNHIDFKRRR